MSNTVKHCDGPWHSEEKWTYTSKNFGEFCKKECLVNKRHFSDYSMHPRCKAGAQEMPQIIYVKWQERHRNGYELFEHSSCLGFLNNSFYLCFRDSAKKLFILLSPKSPRSCTMVHALNGCIRYSWQISGQWGGEGGAGWQERDEISGKKRRKLYWKKTKSKKEHPSFHQGCRNSRIFSWHSDKIPSRGSGAPQCPENKPCEKDWSGSFQFKLCKTFFSYHDDICCFSHLRETCEISSLLEDSYETSHYWRLDTNTAQILWTVIMTMILDLYMDSTYLIKNLFFFPCEFFMILYNHFCVFLVLFLVQKLLLKKKTKQN